MNISLKLDDFEEIYAFFIYISGSHSGLINRKIYQISQSDSDVFFLTMTADFPNYHRMYQGENKISYHLSGYGLTREDALIRLIGESIERYSVVFSYEMFKDYVIYASEIEINQEHISLKYINVMDYNSNKFINMIHENDKIGWYELWDIVHNKSVFVPAQLFFINYSNRMFNEKRSFFGVSTGTAAHTSLEKSLENSLVEYLQIDSFILFWYAKNISVPEVVLDSTAKKFLKENNLLSQDYRLLILDFTLDKPFPIFGVFVISDTFPFVSFGVQGGDDPLTTLYRGVMEALTIRQYNYSSILYDKKNYDFGTDDKNKFYDLDTNVTYWASSKDLSERLNFIGKKVEGKKCFSEFKSSQLTITERTLNFCEKNSFTVATKDITCFELDATNWSVIRCIIPELLPMCLPGTPFVHHPRFEKFGGVEYVFPHPLP